MAHLINVENKTATVLIDKDFNFKTHKSFTNAVKESLEQGAKIIVLEFKEVEYMDSTALGLLMVAKDNAEGVDCEIKLQNVTGYARKIIEMSQFDKKFEILG
jgi:anti-anti-sigma factor|tara:strand:- start:1047 stop:1352 length:306 start_codon:yes stop_codon:yes gene_type:complete